MKKHFPLFFICLLFVTQIISAQNWQPLGPWIVNYTTPAYFYATHSDMAIDANGIPYMAADEIAYGNKLVVRKLSDNYWVPIGGDSGVSAGAVGRLSIAFDGNGILYAAIEDSANNANITVMKYDGSSWTTVGAAGFSPLSNFGNLRLVIDPFNTPYVTFSYYQLPTYESYGTVMKYDGSAWITVGDAAFDNADFISMAIDAAGVPYVTYVTAVYGSEDVYVEKFNGSSWEDVGTTGYPSLWLDYSTIAIDSTGTPYIFYEDSVNNSQGTVRKFNGSQWVVLGDSGFTDYPISGGNIAIGPGNIPYIAYNYGAMVFSDGSWVNEGNFSSAGGGSTTLKLAPDGTQYISYINDGSYVDKYNGTGWVIEGLITYQPTDPGFFTIATDPSGTPYAPIADINGKVTVLKYNGSNWVPLGDTSFTHGNSEPGAINFDKNGTPYLFLSDSFQTTVLKYNGSTWVQVGNQGFADYGWWRSSIAIDTSGTPWVAFNYQGFDPSYVMTLSDNTWTEVGDPLPNNDFGYDIYITIGPDNIPYVSYMDGSGGGGGQVWEYVNGNWVSLYDGDITGMYAANVSQQPDGTVYLPIDTAYINQMCQYYCQTTTNGGLYKYTNGNWVNVGNAGFSLGAGPSVEDKNGNCTMLYNDGNNTSAVRYDGISWMSAGQPDFATSIYFGISPTMAIDTSGTVYVVGDGTWGYKYVPGVNQPGIRPPVIPYTDICPGATIQVNFGITGTFNTGNVFTAQLSDKYGTFSNPVNIGSITSTSGGTINAVIPDTVVPDSYYPLQTSHRIRIMSSNPAITGIEDMVPLTITGNGGTVTANAGNDTTINACVGSGFVIGGLPVGGAGYSWSPGAGLNDSTSPNPVVNNISNTTTYTVTVVNGCNSSATASVTVNMVKNYPTANAGSPQTVCAGASVTLGGNPTASGGTPVYSYLWSGGAAAMANPVVTPMQSTTYTVTVTDAGLCTATSSVGINITSAIIPTISITSNLPSKICAGEIGTFRATVTNAGSSPVYTWKIDGVTVQSGRSTVYSKLFEANTIYGSKFNISCVLTSDAPCASPLTVASDTITLNLESKPIRTTIRGQSEGVCGGSTEKYICDAVAGATDYLWVFPRGCKIDSGQLTTSITVTFPANYDSAQIEVVTDNSCGMGAPAYLTVTCDVRSVETGEEELPVNDNMRLNIYPNPNNGQMYIDLQQAEPAPVSYKVYNVMGQMVYQYNSGEPVTNLQQQLDLSTQASGMYFIQVRTGETVLEKSVVVTK